MYYYIYVAGGGPMGWHFPFLFFGVGSSLFVVSLYLIFAL